jgi:hypothetical protein
VRVEPGVEVAEAVQGLSLGIGENRVAPPLPADHRGWAGVVVDAHPGVGQPLLEHVQRCAEAVQGPAECVGERAVTDRVGEGGERRFQDS